MSDETKIVIGSLPPARVADVAVLALGDDFRPMPALPMGCGLGVHRIGFRTAAGVSRAVVRQRPRSGHADLPPSVHLYRHHTSILFSSDHQPRRSCSIATHQGDCQASRTRSPPRSALGRSRPLLKSVGALGPNPPFPSPEARPSGDLFSHPPAARTRPGGESFRYAPRKAESRGDRGVRRCWQRLHSVRTSYY